jgi:hypothetical protein
MNKEQLRKLLEDAIDGMWKNSGIKTHDEYKKYRDTYITSQLSAMSEGKDDNEIAQAAWPETDFREGEREKVGLQDLPFDKQKFHEMEQEIQKHMDQFDLEQRIKAGKAIEDLRSIYITI